MREDAPEAIQDVKRGLKSLSSRGIVGAGKTAKQATHATGSAAKTAKKGIAGQAKTASSGAASTASGASSGATNLAGSASTQVKGTATSATQTGDKTVTQFGSKVKQTGGKVKSKFSSGLSGSKGKLDATAAKVQSGTGKIPGENQGKVSEGQAKVNAEASKEPPKEDGGLWGKIKSAAKAAWNALKAAFEFVTKLLSDPGFWVSLVVAVALTALVIGTGGLAAGIVAAIVIGAISSGAGQVVSNLAAGKKWNEGLGTAIAFGALGGAVFGPLGGKVAGAIGSKIMSTAGGKAVSAAATRVGSRVASSAAGRAVSAAGRGAATAARRGASAVRSGARATGRAASTAVRRGATAVRNGARRVAAGARNGARRVAAGARNAVRRGGKPRGGARPKGPAAKGPTTNAPSTALAVRPKPGALVPYRSGLVGHEIIPLKDGWILQVSGNASRAVARHPKFPDMRVIFDHTGVRVWTRNPALRQVFHRPPGGITAAELKEALKQIRRMQQPHKWRAGEQTAADDIWGGTTAGQPARSSRGRTIPTTRSRARRPRHRHHRCTTSRVGTQRRDQDLQPLGDGQRRARRAVRAAQGKLVEQINKDVAIMAENPGTRAVWHFLDAHPSDELREALLAAKIIIRTD